eukprot:9216940-Alexandrium_andersonii.AAC.1
MEPVSDPPCQGGAPPPPARGLCPFGPGLPGNRRRDRTGVGPPSGGGGAPASRGVLDAAPPALPGRASPREVRRSEDAGPASRGIVPRFL